MALPEETRQLVANAHASSLAVWGSSGRRARQSATMASRLWRMIQSFTREVTPAWVSRHGSIRFSPRCGMLVTASGEVAHKHADVMGGPRPGAPGVAHRGSQELGALQRMLRLRRP